MTAFSIKDTTNIVGEAWITAAGRFFFRPDGWRQDIYDRNGYEATGLRYREFYTRLHSLADACADMASSPDRF